MILMIQFMPHRLSGENSDLSKVLADLTSELESIKTEVQTLKREKQQKQQLKFTKVDKDFICYNCGKPGIVGAKAEI